jgi:hypothetical protein
MEVEASGTSSRGGGRRETYGGKESGLDVY